MTNRPTLRAGLLTTALLAPHAVPADEGLAISYAKLMPCAMGNHAACPAPPVDPAALDPDRSFMLTCHERVGAGWLERVPVTGSLDDADAWVAYGATLYVPIEAWTESPGAPVVEHVGAFIEAHAEDGFVLVLEAGWGPAHRALKVALQLDREGRTRAQIRRTRLLRIAPGAEHGYGAELPLIDEHGWPSSAFAGVFTPPGGRLARVVDAHAEWLDCDPLDPAVRQALCEVEQERLPRCGGDLRSGLTPQHAVRAGEVGRAAGRTARAPGPKPSGGPSYCAGQPGPRVPARVRDRSREGDRSPSKALARGARGRGQRGLSGSMRELLAELGEELRRLDERVARFDAQIREISRTTPACRRLEGIPGVGPIVSTALVAAVGDGSEFGNGRELAAWVGVVPRQRSTGGRNVLLGISKRGDQYLRWLFIHGARAALRTASRREDRRSRWAVEVQQRRGTNIATVALANKNLRTAWALLARDAEYEPQAV